MKQQNNYETRSWSVSMQQVLHPINRKNFYNKYVNSLPLNPRCKVLEFGSGIGLMAGLLSRKLSEGQVTCVDISDRYLGKAERELRRYPNTSYLRGRLVDVEIEEETFDAVNMHYVLQHVHEDNRAHLLCEIFRLLKPGGKIYLREPVSDSHGMSSGEINELFMNAGFYPLCGEEKRIYFRGEIFTACYSKLSKIQFFLS